MQILLLSGGSGERLWPLSNEIRAKQFIQCLENSQNEMESMVQRAMRQIRSVNSDVQISIVTQKIQQSQIRNQCGEGVGIILEPQRKGTYPCILSSCLYYRDKKHIDENETIVVCPIDPFVDDSYYQSVLALDSLVQKNPEGISLLGVEPTYPSEKYGYIMPTSKESISTVSSFKEKPNKRQAQEYIDQGALWNAGVFAFRLGHVLSLVDDDYDSFMARYTNLESESFDVAVLEKEANLLVARYQGMWKDIGTWNTFVEAISNTTIGDVHMDDSSTETHVINQLDIPIIVKGMKDCVIAASRQGILVSDKGESSYIKPLVQEVENPIMFAQKSWGSYEVLDVSDNSLTVKVTLNPGHAMNYHWHQNRDETWTVIEGTGFVVIDGIQKDIQAGDVIELPRGSKHKVQATNQLKMIEVQVGTDIDVKDKIIVKEDS